MSQPTEYTPTQWQDGPSTATPVSAANLNHLEQGVKTADQRAIAAATLAAAAQVLADAATTPDEATAIATARANAVLATFIGAAPPAFDTWPEVVAELQRLAGADIDVLGLIAAKYTKPNGGIPLSDLKADDLSATYAQTTDIRLSDQRTPTDASVTDAKVASSAAIAQTKIAGLATSLAAKADLVGGVVPTSQIPALALVDTVTVASQTAMLALTSAQVQRGDIAVRTDGAGTFVLNAADPSQLSSWVRLNAPTDVVISVNGQQGTVVLSKSDIGLANVDNTSDASKPVSTAQVTALALKANLTDLRLLGAPLQAGQFYASPFQTVISAIQPGANTLRGSRLPLSASGTITSLTAEVTTAGSAGAVVRLGLYDYATDGSLALLVDAGTVDATTAGVKTLTVNQVVTRGQVVVPVAVSQGGPTTLPALRVGNGTDPAVPSAAANLSANATCGFLVTNVTGALPATATPGSTTNATRVLVGS